MKNFRSSIIVRTATKRELKLPETSAVHAFPALFAVSPSQEYLYVHSAGIEIYTTAPINKVHRIEYKEAANDMLVAEDTLYILNDESLIAHSKDIFNAVREDFRGARLLRLPARGKSTCVGVQKRNELAIYDMADRTRVNLFRCQCSHAQRDLLLLGDFNILKIFVKGDEALEVALPDSICCIVADALFSRVFCAMHDGAVYCLSMCGEPLRRMEYHREPVKFMRLSLCNRLLYTADTKMLCVWSAVDCVVLGFVELDCGIEGLDLVLDGERTYGPWLPLFNREIK